MAKSHSQLKTEVSSIEINHNKYDDFNRDIRKIERFVKKTVDKLTFAMTIPALLNNDCELIKNDLKESEFERLQQVFGKYLPKEKILLRKKDAYKALAGLSVKEIEKYFNTYSLRTENIPERDEYDISDALNSLYYNKEIRKISKVHKQSISEAAFNFLQDMKLFIYSLMDKMKMSPDQANAREMYLRNVCDRHYPQAGEIHILEQEAILYVTATEKLLRLKLQETMEVKEEINAIIKDFQVDIRMSASDLEKRMINEWKEYEHRQQILEETSKTKITDINLLRNNFLAEEKLLNYRRAKAQQELLQLIARYDKDMQTKQKELDCLEKIVLSGEEQLRELKSSFEIQEPIYMFFKNDKEDNLNRARESRLKDISISIAARKIQNYYKNFHKLLSIAIRKGIVKCNRKKKMRDKLL